MGALTPAFLFDLESNMRIITTNEFSRLSRELWWDKIAKVLPSQSKKERLTWILETAKIERPNNSTGGGQSSFEDMVAVSTEFEVENAISGLKLKKEQLQDLDGNGVKLATKWSGEVGALAAYFPQQEVAKAIRTNPVGYDSKNFFATDHPLNPFNTGVGTYANDFTGGASGAYPGALPIDSSVTVDVALANIGKAIAYIRGYLKMPNGKAPRKLKVAGIMGPAALAQRLQQLTNAKLIAQAAASGGGGADVEAIIRDMGVGQPIIAEELGAAYTEGGSGSDTTWYLLMEGITADELGAFAWVDREPFNVVYHDGMTDAELARARELQWTGEGRNTVGAGHPYLLFRCKAA